ncbi:MAG: hypothetical protein LW629_01805 [Burkholderiales bacterium]|jgi:hypothetical protein|nr:hypothetical protein [Burkholderiales bacterium]
MNHFKHPLGLAGCVAALLMLLPTSPQAQTSSVSGFMTLSYSLSNNSSRYLRSIDDGGTFRSGSIVGVQLDSKFSNTLSSTIQVAAFESDRKDHATRADFKWAILNYRPSSAWLLRGGKMRNNLVLDAQNLDIGATYTPARLPPEIYFSTNLLEYYGGSLTHYFDITRRVEGSLEVFGGRTDTYIRTLGNNSSNAFFINVPLNLVGLNVKAEADKYAAQFNLSEYKNANNSSMDFRVQVKTIGLRGPVGPVMGRIEFFKADYPDQSNGPKSQSGAVIVEKTLGKLTPYTTLAYSKEESGLQNGQQRKNRSVALGAAYSLETLSKLKAELKHIKTGEDSALFDNAPPYLDTNVMTLSFSKIF